MPRKTKRVVNKNKSRRRRGGDNLQSINSKLDQFQISNLEVSFFLIDFLNKTNLKDILVTHFKFINSLEDQNLEFSENPLFRKFINDIVQWFLLDYNNQFANDLLEITKKTIENPQFLNKNSTPDEKYNVLLTNIYDMIAKINNGGNIEFVSLLEILLRGLRMPTVKEIALTNIQQQLDNLIQYKKSIICLLDNIIKKDLLHKEEIRVLIKEIIEDLSYNNVYNWNTFKKLAGLVGNCAGSVTSDLTTVAAKSAYSSTFGKLFSK
jgi:hypothetical protein